MKLLYSILRHNIQYTQILGFLVANIVGATIILCGIQALSDYQSYKKQNGNGLPNNYIVITKPVSNLTSVGSLWGAQHGFDEQELEAIQDIKAVKSIGCFESAQCNVYGIITLGELSLQTDFFLESVPTQYIDVPLTPTSDKGTPWSASFEDKKVPVIVPRNYLNLYNYGYASTHGLPLLSEALMTSFPFELELSGRDRQPHYYQAQVIGFSNRLNTILVPQDFLQDVNNHLSDHTRTLPSRLIIELANNESKDELLKFLEQKHYMIEGDSTSLKMQAVIYSLLFVAIGIGIIISALSFYLLLISIILLLERNKEKIKNLYEIGYAPRKIASPYQHLVLCLDLLVWGISSGLAYRIYQICVSMLSKVLADWAPLPIAYLFISTAVLFTILFLVHRWIIIRRINRML